MLGEPSGHPRGAHGVLCKPRAVPPASCAHDHPPTDASTHRPSLPSASVPKLSACMAPAERFPCWPRTEAPGKAGREVALPAAAVRPGPVWVGQERSCTRSVQLQRQTHCALSLPEHVTDQTDAGSPGSVRPGEMAAAGRADHVTAAWAELASPRPHTSCPLDRGLSHRQSPMRPEPVPQSRQPEHRGVRRQPVLSEPECCCPRRRWAPHTLSPCESRPDVALPGPGRGVNLLGPQLPPNAAGAGRGPVTASPPHLHVPRLRERWALGCQGPSTALSGVSEARAGQDTGGKRRLRGWRRSPRSRG